MTLLLDDHFKFDRGRCRLWFEEPKAEPLGTAGTPLSQSFTGLIPQDNFDIRIPLTTLIAGDQKGIS